MNVTQLFIIVTQIKQVICHTLWLSQNIIFSIYSNQRSRRHIISNYGTLKCTIINIFFLNLFHTIIDKTVNIIIEKKKVLINSSNLHHKCSIINLFFLNLFHTIIDKTVNIMFEKKMVLINSSHWHHKCIFRVKCNNFRQIGYLLATL